MGLVPPQDALFLLGETEQNPTHVTALQILRPSDEPADQDGHDGLAEHLHAVLTGPGELKSAFLRRPVRSWTTAGAYSWEPDADFDITRACCRSRRAPSST